ncbi:ribosomal protein S8E [Rhizobium sp. BK529]|uniref:hypothetical protein n=1 Tax=unclassified Rhizobium TaxID=2613769 RepID=UPI001048CE4C|nr:MULTISPECIES: hypothetical protein [unclassified Rhizobium]MBB3595899.1 ribosomal protein S8E [Rhizobium sp. BK529]TCR96283.1 hypothetical protein EV281_11150 [Rhizobium sp. BK418]
MTETTTTERKRTMRGRPYSLEEFERKYKLDRESAKNIYERFGPSSVELDLLMAAKKRTPSIHAITEDLGF